MLCRGTQAATADGWAAVSSTKMRKQHATYASGILAQSKSCEDFRAAEGAGQLAHGSGITDKKPRT